MPFERAEPLKAAFGERLGFFQAAASGGHRIVPEFVESVGRFLEDCRELYVQDTLEL